MITICPSRRLRNATLALGAVIAFAAFSPASADVFLLQNGGRLEGVLTNPDQEPRTEYIIELDTGGEITLAADQVKQFLPTSEAQRRYELLLKKVPDNADSHWRLAEWCRDKGLKAEQTFHLKRVVEFDPNHAPARRALGFSFLAGEWTRQEDFMQRRGYQLHEGRWKLPHDIELAKRKDRREMAGKEWTKNIKRWRGWLGKKNEAKGWENIRAIDDPLAAGSIAAMLPAETDMQVLQTYIRVLGNLHTPAATKALIRVVLGPAPNELRQLALDQLEVYGYDLAIDTFIKSLGSSDNRVVRRAGMGLVRLQHERAMRPLIRALVTNHKVQVGGGAGQISTSFGGTGSGGTGGLGFGAGGGPKTKIHRATNREVLDALLALTDGVNYQYDQAAWLNWYMHRNAPSVSSLRRAE